MNQPLQLPAPHVGATQEIWDAINVDLQQIVDDVSCWEGSNAERMCTQLEAAVKRLNDAVGHEREGYEAAIASSFEIDALRERCEKLELVLVDKLSAATLMTGMNVQNGGVEIGLQGGAASLLAEMLAQQYKDSGATNYMEVSFTSRECVPGEKFIVTAQRVTGQTPHQFRVQAEAQRDALGVAAGLALEALEELVGTVPVTEPNCSCHISPPCGDCVENSHDRELLSIGNSAIEALRKACVK